MWLIRWAAQIMRIIGSDRLAGRFVWGTVVLVSGLLAITLYAQILVHRSTNEGGKLIDNDRQLSSTLNGLNDILQNIATQIYQYTSLLDHRLGARIQKNIVHLNQQLAEFSSHHVIQADRKSRLQTNKLQDEIHYLEATIEDFLQVMHQAERRYPGVPLMLDSLEPTHRRFSEALELALQKSVFSEINSRAPILAHDQNEVIQVLQELRFAWVQQISWFRLFVANRMGAFSDPEKSVQQNLTNRKIFAKNVGRLLKKLKQMDKADRLSLWQSELYMEMDRAANDYENIVKQVVSIYTTKNWRTNIPLIRDKIQPSIDIARQLILQIQERFSALSHGGIISSQNMTLTLSMFIWLFVAAMIGLLVLAYVVYRRSIHLPMLQMTSAMLAEAKGENHADTPVSDIKEIRQLSTAFEGMRKQLRSRQTQLESILDNAAEGMITIHEGGIIDSMNRAAQKLFGYSQEEVVGKNITILMHGDIRERHDRLMEYYDIYKIIGRTLEVQAQRKDGRVFPMSLKVSEFIFDDKKYFTAMVADVSEHHAVMQNLRFMAEHDSLTGLFNRKYFLDELDRTVAQAQRSRNYDYACLYIDLDNFKYINDTLGHLAGDKLLIEIAGIFTQRIRKSDLLARLGGDEFAILLANVDLAHAKKTADYYREKIARYLFKHKGKSVDVGCSIGVAMLSDDIQDKEVVMSRADIACHMAKRGGRNRIHIYEDNDQANIDVLYNDMGWSRRIKTALEEDKFVFAFQPIMQTEDQSIYTYEVLLRMRDAETDQLLLPGAFLNAADRFGLMVDLDCWVITHAIELLSDIQKSHPMVNFSINLSAKSLTEEVIMKSLKAGLRHNRIRPGSLTFEITEDMAISDMATAVSFILQLKELGCNTALDDFGVGYSSFSYLKELPVDWVKIDGSFVRNIENEKLNYALIKSINDICHTLGKKTVAEFVENKASLALLKKIGIDYVQGYFMGRPELELMLETEHKIAGKNRHEDMSTIH